MNVIKTCEENATLVNELREFREFREVMTLVVCNYIIDVLQITYDQKDEIKVCFCFDVNFQDDCYAAQYIDAMKQKHIAYYECDDIAQARDLINALTQFIEE